jgi:hypothetical protein
MSMFMITCPATGEKVSTGVEFVPEIINSGLGLASALMQCPACGKQHVWTPRGAEVAEEGKADSAKAENL